MDDLLALIDFLVCYEPPSIHPETGTPMPLYSGPEMSERDMKQIAAHIRQNRFDELPRVQQQWLIQRFMASLMTYGEYPPPDEKTFH